MFEPFLELMADAVDTTATLLAVLALWQGRPVRCKEMVARWLGIRPATRLIEVDDFVREARRVGASPTRQLGARRPPNAYRRHHPAPSRPVSTNQGLPDPS